MMRRNAPVHGIRSVKKCGNGDLWPRISAMTRSFSIYFDLRRFGAATIVMLSHFAHSRFAAGHWLW